MRPQPAFDTNLGSSHAQLVRVDLHQPDGAYLATLPIDGGTVSEYAGEGWAGQVTVVGTDWIPTGPDSPLAGFTGHWVRVLHGQIVDQQPAWITTCELLVAGSRVTRSADDYTLDVQLVDLLGWLQGAADTTFQVELGQSVNSAIRRFIDRLRPTGWRSVSFQGSAGSDVTVPVSYDAVRLDPLSILRDLSAFANLNVRCAWDRSVVIEPPRGQTPGTVARTLDTAVDVIGYEVEFGRGTGAFANHVVLEFQPVGDVQGKARWSGRWTYQALAGSPTAGQVRRQGDRWRLHYNERDGDLRRYNLRRVEPGNILEVTAANGYLHVAEVLEVEDQEGDKYLEVLVSPFDTDGSLPANGDRVTVACYVLPEKPVIGRATQTSGPLAVAEVGRVTYLDGFNVNVTQAQANARAAQVLPRMLAGWVTTRVQIVPDPRLQVDDTVQLRYLDGREVLHRVTTLDYPLTVDEPMTVGLRTFDTTPDTFTGGM